ncbi:hypothetical protein [Spirillospora sp. CA-294931]|uniref:hypothetical protein n=1 Tax=Spirillospora sp. CA-294931 TaxID=3240042 RepID=UPI003D91DD8C
MTERDPRLGIEDPEADTLDQHREAGTEPVDDEPAALGLDADEADAAEQRRAVETGEEDYRPS